MARINGINSDFLFEDGAIVEVKPLPSPLELKLFICPTGQKNSLEAETDVCHGQNTLCPAAGTAEEPKLGHAMLHMHQTEGLQLVTDNENRLQLDQDGSIKLFPTGTGKVETVGQMQVRDAESNTILLNVTNDLIILTAGGSSIELQSDGNIQLSPAASGEVTINGNLNVTGTINGTVI